MSILKIPFLKEFSCSDPIVIQRHLIGLGKQISINQINWVDYPHCIDVQSYMGYSDQYLWIHYQIKGEHIKAVYHVDQDPVWQDSCVEFFIRQGDIYRNFEFNARGVCLSAYGENRNDRIPLDSESLSSILRFPTNGSDLNPDEAFLTDWSLTVAIPLELIGLKSGTLFYANLYKCGDQTSIPHYISWSPIGTATPDFHQPSYFGALQLE
jgi:Carbohydrate-binding family 9